MPLSCMGPILAYIVYAAYSSRFDWSEHPSLETGVCRGHVDFRLQRP